MREELEKRYPDSITGFYLRAGRWFASEGQFAKAIDYFLKAKAHSEADALKVRLGTGNGAFIVTPDADPAYSGGLTDEGIVTMTVGSGVSGFKYFSVSVTPVSGDVGDEVLVFLHLRGGSKLAYQP